jgi:hypothetical protein
MPEDLRQLAKAHGVATFYRNERREPVEVDPDVVVRVLGLLEVDAATDADRRRELAKLAERQGVLAPTVATRVNGRPRPFPGAVRLVSEDGTESELRDELPADLAPGCYRLQTRDGQEVTLVAAPPQVPQTPATWGWMLQLYALRSGRSWGIGDLGDLREFIDWTAAEHGAGAVLLNPLNAPGPTHPVQPSPSTPTAGPTPKPGRKWTRCASPPIPSASTTTSSGPPSGRRWSCSGVPTAGPPPWTRYPRPPACATGPPTAHWPSGTAAGGRDGRNPCEMSTGRP